MSIFASTKHQPTVMLAPTNSSEKSSTQNEEFMNTMPQPQTEPGHTYHLAVSEWSDDNRGEFGGTNLTVLTGTDQHYADHAIEDVLYQLFAELGFTVAHFYDGRTPETIEMWPFSKHTIEDAFQQASRETFVWTPLMPTEPRLMAKHYTVGFQIENTDAPYYVNLENPDQFGARHMRLGKFELLFWPLPNPMNPRSTGARILQVRDTHPEYGAETTGFPYRVVHEVRVAWVQA